MLIQLQSLVTPLLVSLTEEGFADNKITEETMHSDSFSAPNIYQYHILLSSC
jgi:hypothetical protein